MTRTLLTAALSAALFAPVATAQVSFDHLAPENSVIVVGVPNLTTTQARYQRTALHALWNAEEIRDLRKKFWEEMEEEFNEALREADLQREDIVCPTGAIGFALFPTIDPETGRTGAAYVGYADFGDRADQAQRVIDALIRRGEREGEIQSEEREIIGRTVRSLTFGDNGNDDWGDDEDDWGFDDPEIQVGAGGNPFDFQTMHLVREGGAFIICNDLGGITEVLDRIDRERPSGLAERADYRAALDQIGSNDAYFVVLTRDLMQILSPMDPTGGMMGGMLPPMLRNLFGEIGAVSAGVLLDAPEGMVRSNMGVYMPRGKRGLTALIDVSRPRGPLPGFVGADAYSYSHMHFDFGRMPDTVQQFIQATPMLQMMAPPDALMAIDPMLRQMTATLSDSVHIVGTLTRPIEADSVHTVLAIESTDTQQFENMFSPMAAQWGLEGRDFLGHRIYSAGGMMGMMGPGMGMPEFALGIGAGHVFVGPTAGVEQTLRAASEPDRAAGLVEDVEYRNAVRRIPETTLISWGYADIVTMIEGMVKSAQATQRQWQAQMREQFPEWADEMDEGEADPLEKIDFDLIRRYIGPSVSWFRSTDNGFVGTSLYLSADEVKDGTQ